MTKKTLHQYQYENERQKSMENKGVAIFGLIFLGFPVFLFLFVMLAS